MTMEPDINARYYGNPKQGQQDYWRYMAAPLWRRGKTLSLLSSAPPERLCDLGCGDGGLLFDIAQRFPGARLTGIDMSSALIKVNRKKVPSMSWHVMDLDSPVPPSSDLMGSFDVVTSLEVIEHVARPDQLLLHALSLARPKGRLVLSTQSGLVRETEKRVGHRQHFSAVEMTSLLCSVGWRAVRVWNSGWPFHDLSKWIANLSPDRAMRRYGEESYTIQQRVLCACLRGAFKLNSSSRGAQLFAIAEKP